ncbi:MAG: class I SAM-dependent methyltransferase [Hoeflea sp.]|nr:class I SAM-dependent methyltransferase [Hoeflea sp.]
MNEIIAKPCPVCGAEKTELIYNSGTTISLNSNYKLHPGRKFVYICETCGHLAGNDLEDAASFYESDYQFLLDKDEEDQLYEVVGERRIYRADHQMTVLEEKLVLEPGLAVLDYGCAKAVMANKLVLAHPRLDMHLFDVSSAYKAFWDRFVASDRQAMYETPPEWQGRFDLVTSFFAFEHISDPRKAIAHVAQMLKPGGQVYLIVPDVFGNAGDLIVVDHVNHFTKSSLTWLLKDAGFGDIDIDADAHRGALVARARKGAAPRMEPDWKTEIEAVLTKAHSLSAHWDRMRKALQPDRAEAPVGQTAAIYGSGIYGAFIHTNLPDPGVVSCFLDQSQWRQGRTLFDTPIIAPDDLPAHVATVYVGLNPKIAHGVMEVQPWFGRSGLRIVYLE